VEPLTSPSLEKKKKEKRKRKKSGKMPALWWHPHMRIFGGCTHDNIKLGFKNESPVT